MTVEDIYFDICPAYDKKVTLKIGFNKIKASPKDIGFTYKYIGPNCDFTRSGIRCPYIECPLVEERNLRRSIRE